MALWALTTCTCADGLYPFACLLQPQALPDVLESLAPHVTEEHLVGCMPYGRCWLQL